MTSRTPRASTAPCPRASTLRGSACSRARSIALRFAFAIVLPALSGCPDLFEGALPRRPTPTVPGATPEYASSETTSPTVGSAPASTGAYVSAPSSVATPKTLGPEMIEFEGVRTMLTGNLHGAKLPFGRDTYGGVDFRIGGSFVQLEGKYNHGHPQSVRIPIGRPFAEAHFLHGTVGASNGRSYNATGSTRTTMDGTIGDGDRVGEYVLIYDDLSEESLLLIYGEHLRDWNDFERGAATSGAEVVWKQSPPDPPARTDLSGIGYPAPRPRPASMIWDNQFFKLDWRNPYPEKRVEAILFRSSGSAAAPFCLAITIDGGTDGTAAPTLAGASASPVHSPPAAVPSATPQTSSSGSGSLASWLPSWNGSASTTTDASNGAAANGASPSPAVAIPTADTPSTRFDTVGWSAALDRWKIERERAIDALTAKWHEAIEREADLASQESRADDHAKLQQDLATTKLDAFRMPRSPYARVASDSYLEDRFAREREYLTTLKDLRDEAPADLSDLERRRADAAVSEIEAALAKLALAERLLASVPYPKGRQAPSSLASAGRPSAAQTRTFIGPAPSYWKVEVDPPASKSAFPRRVSYTRIDGVVPHKTVYPRGPAGFALSADERRHIRLIDLKNGRPFLDLGQMPSEIPEANATREAALSQDGNHFALYVPGDDHRFVVIDFTVKSIRRSVSHVEASGRDPLIFFPTNERLLAIDVEGPAVEFRKLPRGDVETRTSLFATPSRTRGLIAISPGGRYVVLADAGVDPQSARFFDLEAGHDVGAIELAGDVATPHFLAFAFSHDGRELAAYMANVPSPAGRGQTGHGIAVWDVETGRPIYARPIEGLSASGIRSDYPLQWFPNGKGWLVMQRWIVDRDLTKIVQTVEGYVDPQFGQNGAKLLNDEQMLVADGPGALKVVSVTRQPGAN